MPRENIFETVARAEKTSRDLLESVGKGFAFSVPEKIRDISEDEKIQVDESGKEIKKTELLKTTLQALKNSWEQAIEPKIDEIRKQSVKKDEQKGGTDFFTEADLASEETIRNAFFEKFGEDSIRVFG